MARDAVFVQQTLSLGRDAVCTCTYVCLMCIFQHQAAAFGLASATGLTAVQTLTLPLRDAKCAVALAYFTVFAVVIALMKVMYCTLRTP